MGGGDMSKSYDVDSEVNPEYEKTHRPCDYFGIYHVVEFDGDAKRIIQTFENGWGREAAYKLAHQLNKQVGPAWLYET